MDFYFLADGLEEKVIDALKVAGVEVDSIRRSYKDTDFTDVLVLCKEALVFADESAKSNINSISEKIQKTEQSWEEEYASISFDPEAKLRIDDMRVFSGYYGLGLLGARMLLLRHDEFGFSSFAEMIASISGFVFNKINKSYSNSDFTWVTVHPDGSHVKNLFCQYIHGDLRFTQYDVTPKITINPFGEHTSIFRPNVKAHIVAYHSVEVRLLFILYRYAIETRTSINALNDYPEFLKTNFCKEGDENYLTDSARSLSYLIDESLLEFPMKSSFEDKEGVNFFTLPKEGSGCVAAICEDRMLKFSSGVVFTVDDLNPLFFALHKQCHDAFGRTTINALSSVVVGSLEQFKREFDGLKV